MSTCVRVAPPQRRIIIIIVRVPYIARLYIHISSHVTKFGPIEKFPSVISSPKSATIFHSSRAPAPTHAWPQPKCMEKKNLWQTSPINELNWSFSSWMHGARTHAHTHPRPRTCAESEILQNHQLRNAYRVSSICWVRSYPIILSFC